MTKQEEIQIKSTVSFPAKVYKCLRDYQTDQNYIYGRSLTIPQVVVELLEKAIEKNLHKK